MTCEYVVFGITIENYLTTIKLNKMKTIKLLITFLFLGFIFKSCTVETYVDDTSNNYNNSISLPQLMERYELWYIDYNRTIGSGDVPFLSKAFTLSFLNGDLYANNNLVGFGYTANGYGTNIGYYNYTINSVRINHILYGNIELIVNQIASNEIELFSPTYNVKYYLIGYQRNTFDYDLVYYNNIHYFLQEYQAWEKVSTIGGTTNAFDQENYIQFLMGGTNDTFRSSIDHNGLSINQLYWDFTGRYNVINIPNNFYAKRLQLYYNNQDYETFIITIINDGKIRLYHENSGTTYEFIGRNFIPILRQNANRIKEDKLLNK